MALKLFYVPKTRANRPLWLMEELADRGAKIEWTPVRLDVKGGANRTEEYLAIHPHGQVPALIDRGEPVFESVAICLHLADRFIDWGLAPPFGSSLRGRYYQWAAYCPATLEPPIGEVMRHTQSLPEDERVPLIAAKARRRFHEVAEVLTRALDDGPYLLGEAFSAADILVAGNLDWSRRYGLLVEHPALDAYATRMLSRPAARRAWTRE